MKRPEDTFALTSIDEKLNSRSTVRNPKQVQLPNIKSVPTLFMKTSMTPSTKATPRANYTSVPSTRKSQNRSSVTHDLLRNIQQRANQEIEELFTLKAGDLTDTVRKLEKSKYVKEVIKDLYDHVLRKKKEYNSLKHDQSLLKAELDSLNQKYNDLTHVEKENTDRQQYLGNLQEKFDKLQNKIDLESIFTDSLNHMANVRYLNLCSIKDPTRLLKSQIVHTLAQNKILDRGSEYHMTSALATRGKLGKIQENINSQRTKMRELLNQELKKYEERSKAIAFYKQEQQLWYRQKEAEIKDQDINNLVKIDNEVRKGDKLRLEFVEASQNLATREGEISEALRITNSTSVSNLFSQLQKLRVTKESLESLRADLEATLRRQQNEIERLNKEYDNLSLQKHQKDEYDYHTLYDLEVGLSKREHELQTHSEDLDKVKADFSTGLLGLNRIIQKLGENNDIREIRTIKDAIEYICYKINHLTE
ncbi:unnamed protein product [Blepharisma stoltei]|uniref:Uncharacterized protein n=1 Tax=Blepharisma stoltei TaxID=1481888 RepID=A0AAU9J4W7_9CILI|nr:unnamed protein product [Blepharisma stoltei]